MVVDAVCLCVSSQSGVFPSSPLPPPPVDAVSDASGGRLDCNGFIPLSSSSDGMLNPGPFHPSLIRHPPLHPSPQQLSSSASSSSFMSPDGLYLPQLIGSSSSPLFGFLHPPPPPLPSSSSALRYLPHPPQSYSYRRHLHHHHHHHYHHYHHH